MLLWMSGRRVIGTIFIRQDRCFRKRIREKVSRTTNYRCEVSMYSANQEEKHPSSFTYYKPFSENCIYRNSWHDFPKTIQLILMKFGSLLTYTVCLVANQKMWENVYFFVKCRKNFKLFKLPFCEIFHIFLVIWYTDSV